MVNEEASNQLKLDPTIVHSIVKGWFDLDSLENTIGPALCQQEAIARGWLAGNGKRLRPFLMVATCRALCGPTNDGMIEDLRKAAIAVESFHKASLIHDDIEDHDLERYGKPTLHAEHGIPVAVNIGDFLIGEGFRLIGKCRITSRQKAEMFEASSAALRELCRGQGIELVWAQDPKPLTSGQVIDVFRRKTAPAFDLSLKMGASYAGRLEEFATVLGEFSNHLGIAYQIRDDLNDIGIDGLKRFLIHPRPNIVLALAWELAGPNDRLLLESLWRGKDPVKGNVHEINTLIERIGAHGEGFKLLQTSRNQAVHTLGELSDEGLRFILSEAMSKMFESRPANSPE